MILNTLEKVKIALLPYERDFQTFLKEWEKLNKQNPDIFFFHQEIPGVTYETGRKIGGLLPQSYFLPKTLYFSGHIHKSQKINKVVYVGSPYQTKFSDEGQERYIWLLDSKGKAYSPIKLHYPEFRTIDVSTFREQATTEYVSGNYIRLAGEVQASQWDVRTRRELKEELEELGAKGVSIQVQIIKHRQVAIPPDKIEDDESIIRLFTKDNNKNSNLEEEELIRMGMNLFSPK
jgi:DNA repair exonuclease SbcCD nuclease subunit